MVGLITNLTDQIESYMVVAEYNQCVDAYADRIYRFALKISEDGEFSHQIVQECFSSLWEQKSKIDPKQVRLFLLSNAYHQISDTLYTKPRSNQSSIENQQQNQGKSNIQVLLDKGLKELDARQKALLLLRDFEGLSYKEISVVTQMQETNVKAEIYKSRKALKSYLVRAQFSA